MPTVPYIAFEVVAAQHERSQKRLIIAIILLIVLNFASNAAWLYIVGKHDNSNVTKETRIYSQDGEGVNIIGGAYGVEPLKNVGALNDESSK